MSSGAGPLQFVENRFGDRYLPAVNAKSFERVSAEVVFDGAFGRTLFEPEHLYIILGSDSGLLAEYLLHKGVPADSHYLLIEPEPLLAAIAARLGGNLPSTITLCSLEELPLGQHAFYFESERYHVLRSIGAQDSFYSPYRSLWRDLNSRLSKQVLPLATQRQGAVFARRMLENLGETRTPLSSLTGCMSGRSAVVVGAGPSLKQHIETLVSHRDVLDVVAVARACPLLEEVGIAPDIIVALDPYEESFDYAKGMFQFAQTALLVCRAAVLPRLVASWGGQSCFADHRYPWELATKPNEVSGITVGSFALYAAHEVGYSNVYLAGLDLCYSRHHESHAKSSREPVADRVYIDSTHKVMTYDGGTAETNAAFLSEIQQIEELVNKLNTKRAFRAANLSPQSARIEGIDFLDSAVLEGHPPDATANDIIDELFPPDDSPHRRAHYARERKVMNRFLEELNGQKRLARDGLKRAERYFKSGAAADKQRLERIQYRLTSHPRLSALTSLFGSNVLKSAPTEREINSWSLKQVQEWTREYFNAHLDALNELTNQAQRTRERLASRLEEESEHPDFGRLIAQWRRDNQPGRASVWRLWHPEAFARASKEDIAAIEELEREFERQLTTVSERVKKQVAGRTDPRWAYNKASEAFKEKDISSLRELYRGLEESRKEESNALLRLLDGYISELEGDLSTAAERYDSVTGEFRQSALLRLVELHSHGGELERAVVSMEELARDNVVHMPHLAEMHRMLGNSQKAIDVYTAYLEKHPDDLGNMLKLGMLYHELGVAEGARWIADHVLSRDPGNNTARKLRESIR